MPSYRAKPAAKKPETKPKMPMHKMPPDGHMMPDKDMASHMATKAKPAKRGDKRG